MMCILHYKCAIDDNLAGNEEDSINHDNIDIRTLPVISDSENSYSISSAPLAVPHTTTPSLNQKKLSVTQVATPTLSTSSSDFNTSLQQLENKFCGKMMAIKSYLMDEIYSLKKQKQISQNPSKFDENIEQVDNNLVKIRSKLLDNESKLLREEQDNNEKFLDTILDHNTSLFKYNETLHQNPIYLRLKVLSIYLD